jgi:hypothetical protein
VGSLQAAAALRLLLGVGDAAGRFTAVDVKEGATRTLRFDNESTCPACGLHRTARGVRDDEATDDDSEDEKDDSGCLLSPGAGPVTTTDRPDGER